MSRRVKVIALVLGLPLAAIALLAALLAWALATEPGSRWAIEQARTFLPDDIRFEYGGGVLAGPLELRELVVHTPAATVRVERVRFDWLPSALLAGEARIRELALASVEVELTPGDADPEAGAVPLPPAKLDLPLAVVVERLAVEDIAVHLPDGDRQRIERVALRASAGPDGLAVEHLELSAPLADVEGSLRMAPDRPFELEGELEWRLRPPEPAPETIAGRLEIGGSLERLRALLEVERPAAATLQLQARLFDDAPRWSGDLRLPVGDLRTWWREAPDLAAGGELELEGSFEHAEARGGLELRGLPSGPLRARLDASGSADRVSLERMRIEAERRPGALLTARGEADLATGVPRFDAQLEWNDLAWPLEGAETIASESGSLAVSGGVDEYELAGEARIRTPRTGEEPVRVDWRGTGSTEALSTLELGADWHEARLNATGAVRWAPDGEARLRFDLDGLDPARLAEPLAGRVAANGELHARWGEATRVALALDSLEGELNGRPLAGDARLRYDAGALRIEQLALEAGEARLEASGRVDETAALDWRLAVPRLGDLVPGWGGRIDGEGRVSGTVNAPRIELDLQAAELNLPAARVETLAVNGDVAPLGGGRSTLDVDAAEVVSEAVTLHSLTLRASGVPSDHRLEAELRSDRGEAAIALAGAVEGDDWRGELSRARLTPADLAPWTLAEPVELAWRDGAANVDRACWRNDDARLCAAFSGNRDDWRARLDAGAIPLELIASLARLGPPREDLEYTGAVDAQAELVSGDGPLTGRARIDLTPGKVIGTLDEESRTLLEYGAGRAELRLNPEAAELDAHLPLSGEGGIRLEGRVGRDTSRPLDGRAQARVEDLGLLTVAVPAIGRVEGSLLADIELGGTLAQPSAAGTARLDAGRLELARLGIVLTDLRADLETGDDAYGITLGARSGEGEASADIRLERADDGGWRGSGRLTGEDFRAVDLPRATVAVSPDIEWRIADRDISVSGEVMVPGARFEPRDLSDSVQASPDAEVVGAGGETQGEAPLNVEADIAVTLGPEVHIDAFGLEARLGGSIRVTEQPGQPTTATGELRVEEGTYTIYRQTLRIERGRVIYDGGLVANPGLDVRAVRRPGNVLVGVNVRGTLREPRAELFSEPPMEQSQQLSYLIVGLPLGEASGDEQSNVAAAAAALAQSEQGERLARRFGIQEVTVDQDEAGEGASVVLGRYLSPRLYVGYGIGFAEDTNSVRMRYSLTDNWSLEARSGMTSAADLLYSIEVDSTVDAIPLRPNGIDDDSRDEGDAP